MAVLTFDQIKELLELVADRGLDSVEIERAGFKVKIEGHKAEIRAPATAVLPASMPSAEAATEPEEPVGESASAVPDGSTLVTSPIVGTFYSSPSPEAAPFTRVGDRVELGQVLCIVEAMKLMNEIESDVAGVVVQIFPKNAQPVEYGEPLFAIEAD